MWNVDTGTGSPGDVHSVHTSSVGGVSVFAMREGASEFPPLGYVRTCSSFLQGALLRPYEGGTPRGAPCTQESRSLEV